MPTWILICAKCKAEFEHSRVVDAGMGSLLEPAKPAFEPIGNECLCPKCGYSATYFRTNLLYRA
jgi:hypothetical protein